MYRQALEAERQQQYELEKAARDAKMKRMEEERLRLLNERLTAAARALRRLAADASGANAREGPPGAAAGGTASVRTTGSSPSR